jgi:hypothetical protein
MHRRKFDRCSLALAAVFGGAAIGCYTSEPSSVQDYTTVTTVYDTAAPYGTYKTYALVDSVVHLDTTGQQDNITRAYDELIISTVDQNMQTLGYTKVQSAAAADLVTLIGATTITATGFVSYPYFPYYGWWGGWGGFYGGYGYYYPGYVVPYSYTTGTLLVGIIDNKNRDTANKKMGLIWIGAANALLSGASSNVLATNIPIRINQMFTASPYLKATP